MRLLPPAALLLTLPLAALLHSAEPPAAAPEPPTAVEAPARAEADALAGVPGPLAAAARAFSHDVERWAFLQHDLIQDKNGQVQQERWVRFDPSQPYDEQWTLLKQDGKEATPGQVRQYRERMAKRQKDRKTLGELLDLPRSTLVAETPETLTYEVPLRREGNRWLPPDKFQVRIRVGRAREEFEAIDVTLRAPLRVAVVARIKQGGANFTFRGVDPRFAAPVVALRVAGSGSLLFVPRRGAYDSTRTEFRRVKPWSERFNVKLGPMKFLDF